MIHKTYTVEKDIYIAIMVSATHGALDLLTHYSMTDTKIEAM